MRAKYLKKNIKAVKVELKDLARDYRLKVKISSDPKTYKMWADYTYKVNKREMHIKMIMLPEHKIAYGLYKTSMVRYNVEQQLRSWLKRIK